MGSTFPPHWIVEGGLLALWGIALLLLWFAAARLIHLAHLSLARCGHVRPPARLMLPMAGWSEAGTAATALFCGVSALIAFAASAAMTLDLPVWVGAVAASTWAGALRIASAFAVMTYFLTRVAEHPRWKLVWALCWTTFSMGLAYWA